MLRIVFGKDQEQRVALEAVGDSVMDALSWFRDAPGGWVALSTKEGNDVLVNAGNVLYVEATSQPGFAGASPGDIRPADA